MSNSIERYVICFRLATVHVLFAQTTTTHPFEGTASKMNLKASSSAPAPARVVKNMSTSPAFEGSALPYHFRRQLKERMHIGRRPPSISILQFSLRVADLLVRSRVSPARLSPCHSRRLSARGVPPNYTCTCARVGGSGAQVAAHGARLAADPPGLLPGRRPAPQMQRVHE